ncbi:glyoxal oxidase N-terminus-domain-containing protein [Russula aff. rugulosa BPL654]|nr:glyoxal oxidase N-terminus-domain-containing protein [Russula aff. rugulosa BPL654]
MFVGSPDKVYIIDKIEGNAHQVNGHSAYASVWDLNQRTATAVDVQTNPFCAAGMHLPNASYAVFGGNSAIGPGGDNSSPGSTPSYDPTYNDFDGRRAIRIITPCDGDLGSPPCSWFDAPNSLMMAKARWIHIRGYINRNTPNTDPTYEGGAAEPTYEFYPPGSQTPQTSGLNSYALTYLMPSGKMFVQANYSTILWDYDPMLRPNLPDTPNNIVRVYPASGRMPCYPVDTWNIPASSRCDRITPEPMDGSAPAYVQDDNLPVGRTMGQFIALPDGTLLVMNGASNGTAGYAQRTGTTTTFAAMPFGESLATGPPLVDRWLSSSNIPRLYHSSALLLPDGSVMIAGSNPNIDVNLTTIYPTTYTAEYFYPPYFSAKTRPVPQNGFTTHAMNMGQRIMQLNNTYTVQSNGTITLHTAQLPPFPNLFQPGPAFLFVTINGIPSNGTFVIVGNGQIGTQPTALASVLPLSALSAQGSKTANGRPRDIPYGTCT